MKWCGRPWSRVSSIVLQCRRWNSSAFWLCTWAKKRRQPRAWADDTARRISELPIAPILKSIPMQVVVLGSAPLLIARGLTESLAGRFEILHLSIRDDVVTGQHSDDRALELGLVATVVFAWIEKRHHEG